MKTFILLLLVAVPSFAAEKPRAVSIDVKDEDIQKLDALVVRQESRK